MKKVKNLNELYEYRKNLYECVESKGLTVPDLLDKIRKIYHFNRAIYNNPIDPYTAYIHPNNYCYLDNYKQGNDFCGIMLFNKDKSNTTGFLSITFDDKTKIQTFLNDFYINANQVSSASFIKSTHRYWLVFSLNHGIEYEKYQQLNEYIHKINCVCIEKYGEIEIKNYINIPSAFEDRHLIPTNLNETYNLDSIYHWIEDHLVTEAINYDSFVEKIRTTAKICQESIDEWNDHINALGDEEKKKIDLIVSKQIQDPAEFYKPKNLAELHEWNKAISTILYSIFGHLMKEAGNTSGEIKELSIVFTPSDVNKLIDRYNLSISKRPDKILQLLQSKILSTGYITSWDLSTNTITADRLPAGHIKLNVPQQLIDNYPELAQNNDDTKYEW